MEITVICSSTQRLGCIKWFYGARSQRFFPEPGWPQRQWQYRFEVQTARDDRRLRLLELVGYESLFQRVALRRYRGRDSLLEPGGSGGYSQEELAEILYREGYCGRNGGPVSQSTISRDLEWLLSWLWLRGEGEEAEFYRDHPELARSLTPLERAVGYPIRAPNEPLGRAFLQRERDELGRENYQE